jgi:predicted RecA/RadA family phage recombinase
MKNKVQDGLTLTYVAVATIAAGAGVLLGGTVFGVNSYNVVSGDSGEAEITGVHNLPKAAVTNTAFAAAYWDNTNKVTTTSSSGNTLIGFYTEAGGSAAVTPVRLVPKAA